MAVSDVSHTPLVSVIVPNFNHAPFLAQRIDSVLGQSLSDFELILLDDHSTDDSATILREYERRDGRVSALVVNESNSGSTFAQWRRGLELARGRYVWIAESDDFAEPDLLATLVDALERHPQAAMAFCGSVMVDAQGLPIPDMDWDRWRDGDPTEEYFSPERLLTSRLLWTADVYNASMVVFRRNAAPAISDEHTRMRYCGDWRFWAMMTERGGGVLVRRKLNRFRQHNAKVSPGASKAGVYFFEGLPIMAYIADRLNLSPTARRMLAGRTLRRLDKFGNLKHDRADELRPLFEALSPGAWSHSRWAKTVYEIDKYFNFCHLQR